MGTKYTVDTNGNLTLAGTISALSANFLYNGSGQLILTDAGDGNVLILNNTNSSAVGHQMSFQLFGTNTFSIGHNNLINQSYLFSASTVLKFGTGNAEVARFSGASLGIGTSSPNAAVILQVESTTQAFAPPRMTTTQKNAISSPLEGSIVYDTTLHKLCVRTASVWETITSV
jgi:hypothetical protein